MNGTTATTQAYEAEHGQLRQRPHSHNGNGAINVGDPERAASVATGAALAVIGVMRGSTGGWLAAALGAGLLYRGMSGHCPMYQAMEVDTAEPRSQSGRQAMGRSAVHVEQAITINRSPQELYDRWRRFEELPGIMSHLKRVEVLDGDRTRWTAKAPGIAGGEVSWEARITHDEPGRRIAWTSLENADVHNAGEVSFTPGPGDRGTVVRVVLDYRPPAGRIGRWIATLAGENPTRQVRDDLRRFKAQIECGDVLTLEGQPRGQCQSD